MAHKEGPQGALGQERRALLGGDVLAAAHAAVDLEVQGFALLLGFGCVGLVYTVPELELVGFAPVQRCEARDQMDELPRGGGWRPGRLQLVFSPHGWRARWGHGGDNIWGARWGADYVPLPGRRGQRAVA